MEKDKIILWKEFPFIVLKQLDNYFNYVEIREDFWIRTDDYENAINKYNSINFGLRMRGNFITGKASFVNKIIQSNITVLNN